MDGEIIQYSTGLFLIVVLGGVTEVDGNVDLENSEKRYFNSSNNYRYLGSPILLGCT